MISDKTYKRKLLHNVIEYAFIVFSMTFFIEMISRGSIKLTWEYSKNLTKLFLCNVMLVNCFYVSMFLFKRRLVVAFHVTILLTIFSIDKSGKFLFGDGVFQKKPRPQTDFYLSLLNCVFFYFSFFVGIFGFSNLSLFGIAECFCTICFFTHFQLLPPLQGVARLAGYNPLTPNSVSRRLFFLTIVPEQLYCNGKVIFVTTG